MNSFRILYQVYQARYSLTRIQEVLDQGYKLALIGPGPWPERLLGYLGENRPADPDQDPPAAPPVRLFSLPIEPEQRADVEECEAALVCVGDHVPEEMILREMADSIPLKLPCLWLVEATDPPPPGAATNPHLPNVYRLDPEDPGPILCSLLIRAFPDLALGLARDFSQLRFHYARRLVRRSSSRNAVLAAASSVTIPAIPVVSFLWGLFATTGETLVITASQIRLCLLMAALHGRPVDFFDRVGELWPIVGSAFGWRTLARELLGLVPLAGWALKASIAYSGTWMVGEASRLYYEMGQPTEIEVLREIQRRARKEAVLAVEEQLLGEHPEPVTGDDPIGDEALERPADLGDEV